MLVAVDELVKNKKTPDIDSIELYEWACRDFFDYDVEYADSLGPLRARWVKANASSPLAVQCLQACLARWDLVSAQQVRGTRRHCQRSTAAAYQPVQLDCCHSGQDSRQLCRSPLHVLEHQPYVSPFSVSLLASSASSTRP